jgi:mono/diheme cytochrome c family protein
MSPDAQSNLKTRKILFVVLLALACIAVVYTAFQNNKPWVVPEEVKRMKNPLTSSETTLRTARGIYMDECAQCHGERGKGDGPEAAMHSPAPSNLTDGRHMNTVTDGELFYQISEGRKPMPSFKRRLPEDRRWGLVLFVRTFSAAAAPSVPEKMTDAGKKTSAPSKE